MRYTYSFFIIILIVFSLHTGCQQDNGSQKPSFSSHTDNKNIEAIVTVNIGGKKSDIDPNLSYKAVGVWTNPNPRPLTDDEMLRLKVIQKEIEKFETQLEHLRKELEFLKRIDKPHIKNRFLFGKPHHLSSGKIIDLGEFPMEIEDYTPQ